MRNVKSGALHRRKWLTVLLVFSMIATLCMLVHSKAQDTPLESVPEGYNSSLLRYSTGTHKVTVGYTAYGCSRSGSAVLFPTMHRTHAVLMEKQTSVTTGLSS